MAIYSYVPASGLANPVLLPDQQLVRLGLVDGREYVFVTEGVAMPAQASGMAFKTEPAELDAPLRAALAAQVLLPFSNDRQADLLAFGLLTDAEVAQQRRAAMPPLSAVQLRHGLLAEGLLDDLEAALGQDRALQIWYEYATQIERLHPAVAAVAMLLGKDESWLDGFFARNSV